MSSVQFVPTPSDLRTFLQHIPISVNSVLTQTSPGTRNNHDWALSSALLPHPYVARKSRVGGFPMTMLVDSGSSATILRSDKWLELPHHNPELEFTHQDGVIGLSGASFEVWGPCITRTLRLQISL